MEKQTVEVKEFSINEVQIPIVGISPLIVHKFSEKARKQIEEKQAGKAQNKKHDIRDPQADYEGAKHISADGWDGFPAAGFKAAMIRGAKIIGMVMKDAVMSFFVKADCEETQLVTIDDIFSIFFDYHFYSSSSLNLLFVTAIGYGSTSLAHVSLSFCLKCQIAMQLFFFICFLFICCFFSSNIFFLARLGQQTEIQ